MEDAHVVQDFYIGNTRIRIADDRCIPAAEANRTLSRIVTDTRKHLRTRADAGTDERCALLRIHLVRRYKCAVLLLKTCLGR